MRFEDISPGSILKGLLPEPVTVIAMKWHGSDFIEMTYRSQNGNLGSEILTRDREAELELLTPNFHWNTKLDGAKVRLASEAYRIQLAHLFDPHLAIHTSRVDPLPHQITAVYETMLARQPLRFLLADDPGAGKTIMAGLLIKELLIRGDLRRCLIVCPGSLAEQWQDELYQRFQLPFEIMTNDKLEAALTGNWLSEVPLAIARLDKLARDEALQSKLEQTDWDLIICDEAHKMSASFFGSELKLTKRYRLGQLLSKISRHFLLMTATPHNGKEEDFQLFMALLDPDRFEGRFREGEHQADTSDLMRRLTKENLVKFDGKPLFPERYAYPVLYTLNDLESQLYRSVTDYVREEFNRADALGENGRKGTVGFALTILQRRLASSPEAIYQSLKRRRERLEERLKHERMSKFTTTNIDTEDLEDLDAYEDEMADFDQEVKVVDQASAARTIAELEAEITILKTLEALAADVRRSGQDRKWMELSRLLQENQTMRDPAGGIRKLVIFTEHRDTLNYLHEKISLLLGRPEAVVTLHGGINREERQRIQASFTQDKNIIVLIATDAAGEGINLQRAHLMVNYDLPWNPNRLEQRFGRIHRIGQTEVCHLWNLIADNTREGHVFQRLFEKLEQERKSLQGKVFDVLGKLTFDNRPLRDLLVEAIRYGDKPEVRAKLDQVIDGALNRERLEELLSQHALSQDTLSYSRVQQIREAMERAEARRLQPHFVAQFFFEAFKSLGGSVFERESGRYEITHVPHSIRSRPRPLGVREVVLERYERITFDKTLIYQTGKPPAIYLVPGHPLLHAVTDLILERHSLLLRQGAVLVDESDHGTTPRALFYLEHTIQDARKDASGHPVTVSKQLHFVELDEVGNTKNAGYAPYLDYRPLKPDEAERLTLSESFQKADAESKAMSYAITQLLPQHYQEVKLRKDELIAKTKIAVKDRLTKEIRYWDHRANQLRLKEEAGKQPNFNSLMARRRADDLQERLERRMRELEEEIRLLQKPPVMVGGVLVIPAGLLHATPPPSEPSAEDRARIEQAAMQAVINHEIQLGHTPRDVSKDKCGYDIESKPAKGPLRFIEVKGRSAGATMVTITKNEILTALNKPEEFILAIVLVNGQETQLYYVKEPFAKEPDFDATSVNYDLASLLTRATVMI